MAVFRVGKIISDEGQDLCLVRNISSGGLMANVFRKFETGKPVTIELRAGQRQHGKIAWMRDNQVGVAFDTLIDVAETLGHQAPDDQPHLIPRAPRVEIHCAGTMRAGAHYRSVELCDISQGGAKVKVSDFVHIGDEIVISTDGLPPWPGVVRWVREGFVGLSFKTTIPFDLLAGWAARRHAQ